MIFVLPFVYCFLIFQSGFAWADFDLGGPCLKDRKAFYNDTFKKIKIAEQNQDYSQLVTLRKQEVRYFCWNSHTWARLAESYLNIGDKTSALLVVEEMYRRKFEVRPRRYTSKKKFHSFLTSNVFETSTIGKTLEKHKIQSLKRRLVAKRIFRQISRSKKPKTPQYY